MLVPKARKLFALALLPLMWMMNLQEVLVSCQIIALSSCQTGRECTELVAFTPEGSLQYSISTEGYTARLYRLSPDYRAVAIEEDSMTISSEDLNGHRIRILDISTNKPSQLAAIPDMRFLSWSHKSDKLLLISPDHIPYVYDVIDKRLRDLLEIDPEPLRAFKAIWSPDDSLVAFVGDDFVRTTDRTQKLYIADADGSKHWRLSGPNENVDSAAELFPWLSSSEIAFTSCAGQTCQLILASPDGSNSKAIGGQYSILGQVSGKRELLIVSYPSNSQSDLGVSIFNVETEQLTSLFKLPRSDEPVLASISPRGSHISYRKTQTGAYSLFVTDLHNLDTLTISTQEGNDAGTWNPNDTDLLFETHGVFYIFNVQTSRLEKVNMPTLTNSLSSPNWLCNN